METCTGYYGPCDHTACHSSVVLSAQVPLPLFCHDSGEDPGRHTSERKTATVRAVWEKRKETDIEDMADTDSHLGNEEEGMKGKTDNKNEKGKKAQAPQREADR